MRRRPRCAASGAAIDRARRGCCSRTSPASTARERRSPIPERALTGRGRAAVRRARRAARRAASRWRTSSASTSSTACDFAVDPAVLIPRPETELLVELALAAHAARRPACSISAPAAAPSRSRSSTQRPDARVVADRRERRGARRRASATRARYGLRGRIGCARPLVRAASRAQRFDLIVSQPALRRGRRSALARATCASSRAARSSTGADGLDAIRAIVARAPRAPAPRRLAARSSTATTRPQAVRALLLAARASKTIDSLPRSRRNPARRRAAVNLRKSTSSGAHHGHPTAHQGAGRRPPVVLYMKGTPQFPQCGFSALAVQVLERLRRAASSTPSTCCRTPRSARASRNTPTGRPSRSSTSTANSSAARDIMREMYQSGELQKLLRRRRLKRSGPPSGRLRRRRSVSSPAAGSRRRTG